MLEISLSLLFLIHLGFVVYLAILFGRLHNETLDSMSKLAQLGMVFNKSKTVGEAVQNIAALENELAAYKKAEGALEEELVASPGLPIGFKDEHGRVIKFMAPPDQKLLNRIPKKRWIYS